MSINEATNTKFNAVNGPCAWMVWTLSTIFYFYEFLLQVSPSVMSGELMRDFGVTSQTLGLLAGVYFYSYAGMQLPGGMLIDKYGPHRLLTMATFICAISTIAFGITDKFYLAAGARLMIGFGSAFACVGSMKLATNWFSSDRFALLTGLMVTVGMLGAIGGEAPLALFIDAFGWRQSMIYLGIAGLVISVLVYLFAYDTPSGGVQLKHEAHDEPPLIHSLLQLIKNKQLWLVALYGGLIYLPTPVFCGLWGVPFIMAKLHISKAMAAHDVSLIFIGWAIGGPVWGDITNRIGKRKVSLWIAAIGGLITLCYFIYLANGDNMLLKISLLIFGFFSSGFLPAFALAKELTNPKYVATSLSFMNMMNMVGIAIVQPLIGVFLDWQWSGNINNGVRHYTVANYESALVLLPGAMFIAAILLFFIKETNCRQIEV